VPALPDPQRFAFVPALEAAFPSILAELQALTPDDFAPSPDSLTEVRDGYDETGWHWFGLFGEVDDPTLVAHRARCPATVAACAAVPGLVNAGLSLFRPGTSSATACPAIPIAARSNTSPPAARPLRPDTTSGRGENALRSHLQKSQALTMNTEV
jgi:hypothetical protein